MEYEVKCKHCSRFLFKAVGTTIVSNLPCPNSSCRAKLNIKVINYDSSEEERHHKFATPETPPKTKQ